MKVKHVECDAVIHSLSHSDQALVSCLGHRLGVRTLSQSLWSFPSLDEGRTTLMGRESAMGRKRRERKEAREAGETQ